MNDRGAAPAVGVELYEMAWPAVGIRFVRETPGATRELAKALESLRARLRVGKPFGLVFAFQDGATSTAEQRRLLTDFFEEKHEPLSRLVKLCCVVGRHRRARSLFVRLSWAAPIPFEWIACPTLDEAVARIHERVAVEATITDERRRIARELHDGLGASLSGLLWRAERCRRAGTAGEDDLADLVAMAQRSLAELRVATFQIERAPLQLSRWCDALKDSVAALVPDAVVSIVAPRRQSQAMRGDVGHDLLRVVQEAARNAVRHGNATQVRVFVVCTQRSLRLSVTDDGVGYHPADVAQSQGGLRNIRERLARLGGQVQLATNGRGTSLTVEIPAGRCLAPL